MVTAKYHIYSILLIFYCTTLQAQQVYHISQESDDAREVSYFSAISQSLIIGKSKVNNEFQRAISGIRFQELQLTANTLVDSAFIQFSCEGYNDLIYLINIFGEANGTPITFDNNFWSISSREKTQIQVDWQMEGSCEDYYRGPLVRSPDVSSIIHEIIQLPDWSYGQSIVFIFEPAIDSLDEATTLYGNGVQSGSEEEAAELIIYTSTTNTTQFLQDDPLQVQLLENPAKHTQLILTTKQSSNLQIEIMTVSGQLINQQKVRLDIGEHYLPLSLPEQYANGVYFIRLLASGKSPTVLKWIRN